MSLQPEYILTLSCPDQRGIVHRVSGFLSDHACNIIDSAQFGDAQSATFFMRVHFALEDVNVADAALRAAFGLLGSELHMNWQLHDAHHKPRVILMVSKIGHCLNDLLFRYKSGLLPVEIKAIVSNHTDFYQLAASYNIPFHHLPLAAGADAAAKQAQEQKILALVAEHQIELVVLARYMQILSPQLCTALAGKAINIHHSFLPSFKGAKPYYQAHERGVKLIGATAHFVTGDLDEGPIIEQDVERVDHSMGPDTLTAIGRDVECVVLARAVKCFVEHRILLNGHKTVVFK
ncbi:MULTISPECIES: formyltetrahydrofolate deformylase [unclassified Undibacterium]|uniref:formyltetrahydrofolate deformylase n=1 Tax=unclassified Undibacterium TaxID=2630295 RepID=UPI002AC9687B|nr:MULTISPECIES: formyltetrahydrofolate deformylase [unclassified Undibacterium]MEB0140123.1 formyltetrahydrofolate deformylase [Undibacterium sp. CCC2.1]MEB0173900.1 formyltetrahydrofolate deformylase [Undibacterium sp. CCC1.1]MEB0178230.1 formyltetrahydrofolate deformylase [Undibacterium sp. CCC3.4]MEB0214462.1 formyltetrahydrofolate deformylase [Undibacterium sp. 5I2]WPX42859.1 formyltetrahydrofolate deformylase [Undibacterium sp. CCC3.4]